MVVVVVVVVATCRCDGQYLACPTLDTSDDLLTACSLGRVESDAGNITDLMRKFFINHNDI